MVGNIAYHSPYQLTRKVIKMKVTTYNLSCPYFVNGHKNVNGMAICDEINRAAMAQGITNESFFTDNLDAESAELYGITISEHTTLTDEGQEVLDKIKELRKYLDEYEVFVKDKATPDTVQDDYDSLLEILNTAIDGLQNG